MPDRPETEPAHEEPRGSNAATSKETLTALAIAFVMAFIFRAFVLEAFLIPTGSMAPTLLGAHVRIRSDLTGFQWTVGPWDYDDSNMEQPSLRQGTEGHPVIVHDPMTGPVGLGRELRLINLPRLPGDRIFVFKYLYSVFDPARWDVVVFKWPVQPTENYIKRLIGLPGEQVALIDGDVFVRPASIARDQRELSWSGPGWSVCRKPERVQRTMWSTVHDTRFMPRRPAADAPTPWAPLDSGWSRSEGEWRFSGSGRTVLAWDWEYWPVTDWIWYNQTTPDASDGRQAAFPVADLMLSTTLRAQVDGLRVAATIRSRAHEFRGEIDGDRARVTMTDDFGTTVTLHESAVGAIGAGSPHTVEFWHADQCLWLFLDGRLVAGGPGPGEYDWTPEQRVRFAMEHSVEELASAPRNAFASPGRYSQVEPFWEFEGGAVTIHRLVLARDVYYRADTYSSAGDGHSRAGSPALGTHPGASPILGPDQFFVCGDNSGSSADSRLWDRAHSWVRDEFPHASMGMVPRELLIGKAFFVYFPAIGAHGRMPIPDFGRMRFIW